MIKIEKTQVYGIEAAIRGLRNPLNSWDLSDTYTDEIGVKDKELASKLIKAGDDHGKIARFIHVSLDITAPMYFWKEFDTYKIGTTRMSCSTMHKIHSKEITIDDFSHEHLFSESLAALEKMLFVINSYRKLFVSSSTFISAANKKDYWWQMIQLLPSSYNQKATIDLNYQVLRNIYHARKNHRLDEWRTFCEWIKGLPYAKELIIIDNNEEDK